MVFGLDRLFQLLFLAVLGRLLSPADFGVLAATMVFIAFAQIFSELGVGAALTQASRISDRMIVVANGIILGATLLLFAGAQAAAPLVAGWFRNPALLDPVRTMSLLLLVQAFGIVPQALLLRRFRARHLSLIELASGLFGNVLVAVPMAVLGFSHWALVFGMLAQASLRALLLNLAVAYPRRIGFSGGEARALLFKGTGFSIATIFNMIALQADNLIVGRYLSAHALGLYSRAYLLMAMPTRIYQVVVDRTFFPALAQVQNEPHRLRSGWLNGVALTATVGLPLSLFVALLAPETIAVLLGGQWEGAVRPFQILCLALYFRLSYPVSGTLLRATGAAYRLAFFQFAYAVLVVGGCLVGYRYGIEGVAAAVAAVIFVMWAMLTASALGLSGIAVGDYLRAHASGAASALLVAAMLVPVAWLARSAGVGPLATLLAAAVVVGGGWLAAAYAAPRLFLGPDGTRLLASLGEIGQSTVTRMRRAKR